MNTAIWLADLPGATTIIHDNLNWYCDVANIFIWKWQIQIISWNNCNSNMTFFFRFVNKRAIYRLGIISLAHELVHVTDFPVVNVHVDEISSARIWQHKSCATLSANVNINCCLPIKVYYRICTRKHIRIEIIHGSKCVLSFNMGWQILGNFIPRL